MGISHLIALEDYSVNQWNNLIEIASDIKNNLNNYKNCLNNKILASLFFEPSTRTMLSFQSAFLKLGGQVIGFDNSASSSLSKGEDIADTIRVVSTYSDVIVVRHPIEGACKFASLYSKVPLINAGDGSHLHPTQTLTDLLTIKSEQGRLDNLTIGICGDLRHARTVHSIIKALSCYENNKIFLISTKELILPNYIKDYLINKNIILEEVTTIEECIEYLDILYVTRIQKERFSDEKQYIEQKDIYVVNNQKIKNVKPNFKIMHALPRIDEISREIDSQKCAIYFNQVEYGLYMRMAILLSIMENKLIINEYNDIDIDSNNKCLNVKCITNNDRFCQNKSKIINNKKLCYFCDKEL